MKVFSWTNYKAFFGIQVLRFLVIWFSVVPILAKAFEGVPESLKITIGDVIIPISLKLPFTWQILWASSFFYFIALAIYHLACPRLAKKYTSYPDWLSYGHDPRWLTYEANEVLKKENLKRMFVDRMAAKKFIKESGEALSPEPIVKEKTTIRIFEHGGKTYEFAMPIFAGQDIDENATKGIFWEILGPLTESRLFLRGTILVCLTLSGILFLIVLVQHIASGASLILK